MTVDTSQSITVRKACTEDIEPVANLGSHVFSVTFGHSVEPHQLQAYLEESYSTSATARDIADPTKDMIVATSDGAIVGFGLLTRGTSEPCIANLDRTIELQRIYVHPDCHGQGVGKLLANRMETMARKLGFRYIWLGVWEENYKAQTVYEKLGYKVVGDHDFVIGDVVQKDHIMLKTL